MPRTAAILIRRLLPAVAAGTFAIIAVALVTQMPLRETLSIVAIAVGASALVSACGAVLLFLARRRSIGTQSAVLSMTVVASVLLGSWGVASAMFLSKHDFAVLLVVLMASAVAAFLGSLALGWRMHVSAEELILATREIGTVRRTPNALAHPNELGRLEMELRNTAERLRIEQSRAENLERSRRELIAWVSDDVSRMVKNIQTLVAAKEPNDADEIQIQADRLLRVVEDLLELNGVSRTQIESMDDLVLSNPLRVADR